MRETTALRNASKRDEFEQPGAACPVDDVHQHVELGDRPGRRLLVQEGGTLERLKEAAYRATRPAAVSASARSSSCQRLGTEQQLEHRRRLERREDGGTQLKVGDDEIVDADRGVEHEESFPGERWDR